ncbi:hypothetical protein UFOVP586_14 [uncultured Caudovirales phage]|uniref:Concanavalin A-like lectin/glucanases superfamily n=1 Tax=uncultured Caudovirales phage TaxID=2100421 RepID=A0A6J5MWN7_9CAUD|nr:hypothetical protein UFOVP586_14 [uncultured Caudovirales phage]
MITPSFSLTATERVLPRMALDFTTASLDSRVTFTRSGNTATVTNSSGVIAAINANLPRFDFDPITLACKGLLIEEAKTNLLLNSLIDGTSLSTQLVTTTAVAHTLSFYGTGQIVLTGTSSATVVGTGAYPSRQTLTFTPTVGVLTLTVTGTVQYAQLEIGAFATSFIPTDATTKTRNNDVATMTGTNFSSWFNASEGSFAYWTNVFADNSAVLLQCSKAGSGYAELLSIQRDLSLDRWQLLGYEGGVLRSNMNTVTNTFVINSNNKCVYSYKSASYAASANASTLRTSTGNIPSGLDRLAIGHDLVGSGSFMSGYVQKILYYPQRLINAEVLAFSK